jgi:hypothetical protein
MAAGEGESDQRAAGITKVYFYPWVFMFSAILPASQRPLPAYVDWQSYQDQKCSSSPNQPSRVTLGNADTTQPAACIQPFLFQTLQRAPTRCFHLSNRPLSHLPLSSHPLSSTSLETPEEVHPCEGRRGRHLRILSDQCGEKPKEAAFLPYLRHKRPPSPSRHRYPAS